MKTTVVYYSMSGNTAYAAKEASRILNADLIGLKPEKAYPDKGFRKFFWGGKSAVMAETPALEPYSFDAACDLILICSPVWASTFAPPIRSFVTEQKGALKGKRVAALFCSAGGDAKKAASKLQALLELSDPLPCLSLKDAQNDPDAKNAQAIAQFCAQLHSSSESEKN